MTTNAHIERPRIRLVGEVDHPDFAAALKLVRATASICDSLDAAAEFIFVAQSRAGAVSGGLIESLRRDAPSARIVALLGTWCEGETRTGRPWPGVERVYWYEFDAWWRRQFGMPAVGGTGLIVICTPLISTAEVLSEILQSAGYATVWRRPDRPPIIVRGATAGIWDGGQLNEFESEQLAAFCGGLARDAAPVIALFDFPRRDRCERARDVGTAAVLGKPWLNVDLLNTIDTLAQRCACRDSSVTRAA